MAEEIEEPQIEQDPEREKKEKDLSPEQGAEMDEKQEEEEEPPIEESPKSKGGEQEEEDSKIENESEEAEECQIEEQPPSEVKDVCESRESEPEEKVSDEIENSKNTEKKSSIAEPQRNSNQPISKMSHPLKTIIGDKLVDHEMNAASFEDRVAGMQLIGIYFSAHWCPPCRGFTPKLAQAHKVWKEMGHKIEIIFASSDQDEATMASYIKEDHGQWLALPFGDSKKNELSQRYSVRGIPMLVVLNAAGKVIDESGRMTVMKKGAAAINQWLGLKPKEERRSSSGKKERGRRESGRSDSRKSGRSGSQRRESGRSESRRHSGRSERSSHSGKHKSKSKSKRKRKNKRRSSSGKRKRKKSADSEWCKIL